jgi:ABC-type hemin transport system substrate-binding protein
MSKIRYSRWRVITAAIVATVSLAACGGGTDTADTTVAPESALKIVSLSPTATEMLYAIGAGDQVVAVDSRTSQVLKQFLRMSQTLFLSQMT